METYAEEGELLAEVVDQARLEDGVVDDLVEDGALNEDDH